MDLADYISDGLVGKYNTGSVDIYDHNWADRFATNRACYDAHSKAVNEFVLATYATFIDSDSGPPSITHGINQAGKIKFCDAVNNTLDKSIQYYIDSHIFFNTLLDETVDPYYGGKVKENVTFDMPVVYKNVDLWGTSEFNSVTNITLTINYADNQTLNEQIYRNMITSLADYLHALKNMIKVLTGTTFEEAKIK